LLVEILDGDVVRTFSSGLLQRGVKVGWCQRIRYGEEEMETDMLK
jgi:hypothetical protein